jgi:tRNA(Ile2) C34 agmatinyltransferase TiaS
MPLATLFRRRHPAPPAESPARRALDRSALLAELEVAVPAPERLVRWDTATRECPDCAGNVGRSAGECRHCGRVLASA